MFKRLILLAAVLVLGALAADHALAASPSVVNVSVQEWRFDISPTTATVGTPVEFHIANKGTLMHELVIEKAGDVDEPLTATINGKEVEAESEEIQPGETRIFTWTFAEPGEYWIACHITAHFEAGMKTAFVVAAAPATLPTAFGELDPTILALVAMSGVLLLLGGLGVRKFVKR